MSAFDPSSYQASAFQAIVGTAPIEISTVIKGVHRHDDPRTCGASTIVTNQGSVYANGKLISVSGDGNSHGGGALTGSCNGLYINGKMVVNHTPDSAAPDGLCAPLGGAHCSPVTAAGSENVFVGD
jgi:hypothetical protein